MDGMPDMLQGCKVAVSCRLGKSGLRLTMMSYNEQLRSMNNSIQKILCTTRARSLTAYLQYNQHQRLQDEEELKCKLQKYYYYPQCSVRPRSCPVGLEIFRRVEQRVNLAVGSTIWVPGKLLPSAGALVRHLAAPVAPPINAFEPLVHHAGPADGIPGFLP